MTIMRNRGDPVKAESVSLDRAGKPTENNQQDHLSSDGAKPSAWTRLVLVMDSPIAKIVIAGVMIHTIAYEIIVVFPVSPRVALVNIVFGTAGLVLIVTMWMIGRVIDTFSKMWR